MSKKAIVYFIPAPTAGYTGPGDIASGAAGWYGLRAYSAAYATGSNPAIDITDGSGGNAATINILSTGDLDAATVTTWIGLHGTAYVAKIYDQSGNGKHIGTSATPQTARCFLTASALGSFYALTFHGLNANQLGGGATNPLGTFSQPITLSCVAERTSNLTSSGCISAIANVANSPEYYFAGSNVCQLYAGGGTPNVTMSSSAPHAAQILFNGASSSSYVDGSSTTGLNTGTGGTNNTKEPILGNDPFGNPMYGYLFEAGWWGSDITAHNSAMNSNQHTYWGF